MIENRSEEHTHGYDVDLANDNAKKIQLLVKKNKHNKFVITSAINNTEAWQDYLLSLQKYCDHNNATLIIVPVPYKNVTAFSSNKERKKWWDDSIVPFFVDDDIYLGGNIMLMAGTRIGATMANPLSGKAAIGGHRWTIFAHPQLALEPVATPINTMPKKMYTTGAVTVKNYSRTNEGKKAEFHHVMGAIVVETIGDSHSFVRQLNAGDDGSFYDLEYHYTPRGAKKYDHIEVLAPGDEHAKFVLDSVKRATYSNRDSIVNTLKPRMIVRNDILDGYAGSHHHAKDPMLQFKKFHNDDDNYRKELDQCVAYVNETTPNYAVSVFVASNHHDHLTKWLNTVDPNKDHKNALLISELNVAVRQAILEDRDYDPFRLYLEPRLTCKNKFLSRNERFVVGEVDYSQHGDVGVNGAKGNARGLANTCAKMVIGHSHGARIVKGVYQTGTSTGSLEYEKGLGDHSNTHCIQYPNGKRCLIDIIDGQWRHTKRTETQRKNKIKKKTIDRRKKVATIHK